MVDAGAGIASGDDRSARRCRRCIAALLAVAVASCGGGGDGGGATTGSTVVPEVSSVAGTFSHGQTVTVAGQSFGTKAHAGPMLYDDFDNAAGSDIVTTGGTGRVPLIHQGNLSSYGEWEKDISPSSESGLHAISSSNAALKARSTYHARMVFDGDGTPWGIALLVPYSSFTTGKELYISYYHRHTRTSANWGRQLKAWFAFSSGFAQDKAYWHGSFDTPCQPGDYWRTHVTEGPDEHGDGTGATEIEGEWVRFESYLKQSTPNVPDGAWHQVTYRPNAGTPQRNEAILDNYKMRNSTDDWVLWTFGGAYYDNCDPSVDPLTVDLDEFYMDSTRARVEVCNASTWAARTHCELQLPLTWSGTGITFTFRRGHLGAGPAYLYVVHPSGGVNPQGFPVTVQ